MDLLAQYGSDSEDSREGSRSSSPPQAAAVIHAPRVSAKHQSGLTSKLAPPSVRTGTNGIASSLPADFFDSGRPAGVDTVNAAPSVAREPDLGPLAGPARPVPAALRPDVQDLPQPTDAKLWNKVPAPKAAVVKKRVIFRPAIDPSLLAASDSDEDEQQPAVKKVKSSGPGANTSSFLSFLPAPKHEPPSGSGRGPRTDHFSSAARSKKQQQAEAAALQGAPAAAPSAGPAPLGNEAFRVKRPARPAAAADDDGAGTQEYTLAPGPAQGYDMASAYAGYPPASDPAAPGYSYEDGACPSAAAGYNYKYGFGDPSAPAAAAGYSYVDATAGAAHGPSSGGGGMSETDLIEAAIAAEAAKAAKRGVPVAGLGDVAFKEIKAKDLKYVDPAVRDAKQGMQAVLGTDYVASLRAQAAPFAGDKVARRKHQIGTLFHNARMNEIKLMEQKAAGMKTKAETAGKYGW